MNCVNLCKGGDGTTLPEGLEQAEQQGRGEGGGGQGSLQSHRQGSERGIIFGGLKIIQYLNIFLLLVFGITQTSFSQEARKACKLIQARFNIEEVFQILCDYSSILCHPLFRIQVDDWMAQVDSNQDGKLSYDEFKRSLDGKISVCE